MKRLLKGAGLLVLLACLFAAIPIVYVETRCFDSLPREASRYQPILPPEDRRALADTFLTYPEWSIVHAYEDFAIVARREGEAGFDYAGQVTGYWRRLCALSATASARGEVATDVKAMLYVIGVSFSFELAAKGAYEKTIGSLTQWIGGNMRSGEDRFADALAADYAVFLRQAPWYEYPFATRLAAFWREVPLGEGGWVRSIERRFALTLEWGFKSLYARVMAVLAAGAPAKLTIRSIIIGGEGLDVAAREVEARPDGSAIVETPRYRAFTEFVIRHVERGGRFVEIAGNDRILVTVLVPTTSELAIPDGEKVFAVPVAAQAGWHRRGIFLPVAGLADLVRATHAVGGVFEHVYDY